MKFFALLGCVVLIVALRLLSVWRGWQAPSPRDLTPVVTGFMRLNGRDEWFDSTDETADTDETAETGTAEGAAADGDSETAVGP